MTQELTKHCYTLEKAIWLDNEGFEKGRQHDRQSLGFILPANTSIRICQSDITKGHAIFRLLCNDSKLEKEITLSSNWQTVTATVDTVPFIDTLYTDQPGQINIVYEMPQTVKLLPYWSTGQSETDFYSAWEKNASPYALVDLGVIRFLLPLADRSHLQKTGLQSLQDFYSDVFTTYNEWAGLSDKPELPWNKNVDNAYFVKADKNGVGSAYYWYPWCAQTSSTVSEGWIDDLFTQWTILHEIAHGYQGNFMSDEEIPLSEVWNNVYAAFFQQTRFSQNGRLYTDGWLYNYGKQSNEEKTFINNIKNAIPVAKWGLRTRLLFLMTMFFKGGLSSFQAFNLHYRALANRDGYEVYNYRLTDLLPVIIAAESHYDITPFMLFCGLTPKESTFEEVAKYSAKPVWPLYDLVAESEWENVRQRLGLDSVVWLVDNQQLAVLNKKGRLTLTLNIDKPEQIYGQTLILRSAEELRYNATIIDKDVVFTDIPVGVYTLEPPLGQSLKYRTDVLYVTVREGENSATINYTQLTDTSLRNTSLQFLGFSDDPFATLTADYMSQQLILDITRTSPNPYFANQLYASVTVTSETGQQLLKYDMNGTNGVVEKFQIPLEENCYITVYHAEPGRLKSTLTCLALTVNESHQVFRIDEQGLYSFANNNQPVDDLATLFTRQAQQIRDFPAAQQRQHSLWKNDLWLMLPHFPQSQRNMLAGEYCDVLPVDNSQPGALVGKGATLSLKGLNNVEFCQIAIDTVKHELVVNTRPGVPHGYFVATYASICVKDTAGAEIYRLDYQGKKSYLPKTENIPLEEGFTLSITLEESFRASAFNLTQNTAVALQKNNCWYVTSRGLEVPQPADSGQDNTALYGSRFQWDLLGDNEACFGSMDLDPGSKRFTFNAHAVMPHKSYSTTYATVNVYNTRGSVVLRQAFKGSAMLNNYADSTLLEEGYIVEVFHAEGGHRSVIRNALTAEQYSQASSVSWRVTAKGLERL